MPVLWIVGTGRCGSTLLHELLAAHPEVAVITNLDDRLGALRRGGRGNAALVRIGTTLPSVAGRRVAPSEAYRTLSAIDPGFAEPCRDLHDDDVHPPVAAGLRALVERRCASQQATTFVHKHTGWPRLGYLAEALPDVRIVHVVRDGRAVAASWLRQGWWDGWHGPDRWRWGPLPDDLADLWHKEEQSFTALAGLGWRLLIDTYDRTAPLLPTAPLEIRYEDLVVAPERELDRVLALVGLPPSPAVADAVRRANIRSVGRDAWRAGLRPTEAERLERVLVPTLAARGYGASS